MLRVNTMEEAKKQMESSSEICESIVTLLVNNTKGPQHALDVLTKSIYCVLKVGEIEIDDELEEIFKQLFSKEYIKEQIEKIEIRAETKEEHP
jgi:hypothetical protein